MKHCIYTADDLQLLQAELAALRDENEQLIAAMPKQRSSDKGALSRLVEDLVLSTTLTYSEIVQQVLLQHPTAKTTTRSVASVACVLRRTHSVPFRCRQN